MANAMYSIGAVFELIDRFSGPLKQINAQSSIVESTMSRSTAVFNTGIAKAGAAIKGFGKVAAGTTIASLTAGVGVATKQFIDFDEAMHRGTMYKEFELHAREASCNLLNKKEDA